MKPLTFDDPAEGALSVREFSDGRVSLLIEEDNGSACVRLDRTQAVAAALHIIACALGEPAALAAEKTLAPFMGATKGT